MVQMVPQLKFLNSNPEPPEVVAVLYMQRIASFDVLDQQRQHDGEEWSFLS